MLFRPLLRFAIRKGTLTVIDSRGRRHVFGDGTAPRAGIRLHNRWTELKIILNPPVYVGEAYMDGHLSLVDCTLEDFLRLGAINYGNLEDYWLVRLVFLLSRQARWVKQHNPIGKAQRNVAHHYDLSERLYELFLDRDRQYSCAYFEAPDRSLDQAQEDKKRHLAAKLLLDRPGLKLLDIGSGWGGLGLYMAQAGDCSVTGVTLSVEQHKVSEERAEQAGLVDRVRFHLRDYREESGPYDRIVSVGMFEHVGKRNYGEFFGKLRGLLSEDGVCLLHTIGRLDQPSPINPFIRKYIFPGADLPTLSEIMKPIEASGLFVTDVEVLRLHYAETLRHWHDRFQAARDRVAELYDERFCRMWELYLKGCEIGFRLQGLTVFQIQLTRRLDTLPLTRDYMYEREKRGQQSQAQSARAAEYAAEEPERRRARLDRLGARVSY